MELAIRALTFFRMENPFESHSSDYWRLRLINVFLVLIFLVMLFFAFFNVLVTGLYPNAIIDIVGLLTVCAIILDYRRKQKLQATAHYVVLSIFLLTATAIIFSAKDYGILFWSILLPLFAMVLLGKRQGLYYSIAYYLILLTHLLSSIGRGGVTIHIIIEFVMVSVILVAIIYYYESSRLHAYQQLERRSLQDHLTGLNNRRYFDEIFPAEFKRLKRESEPFAFFLMDVDNFKAFNDLYGHNNGDLALQSIANILHAYCRRPGDYSFRLGGEEFGAIIASDKTQESIQHVEQIRHAIQDLEIAHQGNANHGVVTASFGLILVDNIDAFSPERIYDLADSALYRAKRAGRNCTEITTV